MIAAAVAESCPESPPRVVGNKEPTDGTHAHSGVWQPAGCVSCEPVCVCVSLVCVVIICPASTYTEWAMNYASSSRARTLLTTARALQQECRMPQCGIVRLPHCAAAAPLLPARTIIVNSVVHCEDALSTAPDLF